VFFIDVLLWRNNKRYDCGGYRDNRNFSSKYYTTRYMSFLFNYAALANCLSLRRLRVIQFKNIFTTHECGVVTFLMHLSVFLPVIF